MITPEDRRKEDLENFVSRIESENESELMPSTVSAVDVNTGEVVAQLLLVTFGLIATKAGEPWNLQPDEAELAGNAYGDVIDKYYPDAGAHLGVEVTALLVTGALVVPRLVVSSKTKKSKASLGKVETKTAETVENVNGGFGSVDEMRGSK